MRPDPESLMQFAHALADAARAVTVAHYAAGSGVSDKNAGGLFDPVTEADREAELVMRGLIESRFPDHGVSGEEFPDRPGAGDLSWSLDPIDGTRSFICGLPTWTTLIALLDRGRPVLGVIDAPRLGERYLGREGVSVLVKADGRETPLKTSGCTRLAQARLATTDPYLFEGAEAEAFARVRHAAMTQRYGLDAYAYARLAAGHIDLVVENQLKPHDYNALIPVIRGAGGVATDWRGGESFEGGRIVAAATRGLLDETLALLRI